MFRCVEWVDVLRLRADRRVCLCSGYREPLGWRLADVWVGRRSTCAGGARVCLMWLRIFSMRFGSVISAITRNDPPHNAQIVTSNSKARLSRSRASGGRATAPWIDGSSPFNPDSWDGYRTSRRRVLTHVAQNGVQDMVVLRGDVHSAWGMEIPDDAGARQCSLRTSSMPTVITTATCWSNLTATRWPPVGGLRVM